MIRRGSFMPLKFHTKKSSILIESILIVSTSFNVLIILFYTRDNLIN